MPREKDLYRDNLERLDKAFPDREVLSYIDISRYTGMSKSTVQRRFRRLRKLGGISKCTVARELAD